MFLPSFQFETEQQPPDVLEIVLAPPAPQPAPVALPQPEPAPEVEPKPEPKIEPKPVPKPIPKPQPSPIAEPPPSTSAPESPEPAPPAVMTAEPTIESPPVFTAPPEPPKPSAPIQQDMDAARRQYGNQLAGEIAKHKQYPRIAQMRGWQGEAEVDLQLDGNGKVLSSRISTSSGFEVLDKQALEMVKKASPFPQPPEALRGNSFNILVPVSFRLE